MGVFEQFPYLNFHELNADWVIRKIKELEDKINQEYPDPEHDEDSLRNKKMQNLLSGSTIMPNYKGDYICSSQYMPGAVCEYRDKYYVIDSLTPANAMSQQSNAGYVRVFDRVTNQKISTTAITSGHANSICNYGGAFYIAPTFDYSNGTEDPWPVLLKYTSDFSSYQTINTPVTFNAVSVDPVTGIMYCFTNALVYTYDGSNFIKYCDIDSGSLNDTHRNQDFAVYDGNVYWLSPEGVMLAGILDPKGVQFTGCYNCAFVDYMYRFILGEYEGMEFNEYGQLIGVNYNTLFYEKDCFIIEIPTSGSVISERVEYSSIPYQASVNANVDEDVLFLPYNQIRTIQQIVGMLRKPAEVHIVNELTEPYIIHVNGDLYLSVDADYNVTNIVVDGGNLVVRSQNSAAINFSTSGSCFICKRGGRITLANPTVFTAPNITSGADSNFINIEYATPLITVNLVPTITGKTLMIGTTQLTTRGVYFGSTLLT